jgi:DNA polymerase-3 subunit epsilon
MFLKTAKFAVIDFETNGVEPGINEPLEIGIVISDCNKVIEEYGSYIYNDKPIPPEVSGINNIISSDLKDAPKVEEIKDKIYNLIGDRPIVSHNLSFDGEILERIFGIHNWEHPICTCQLSRVLYLDSVNHKLSTIKYKLDLGVSNSDRTTRSNCHKALDDARATAWLLREEITKCIKEGKANTVEELCQLCWSNIFVEICTYNKHKGKLNREIDSDYLMWILENTKPDFNTRYTYETILEERGIKIDRKNKWVRHLKKYIENGENVSVK